MKKFLAILMFAVAALIAVDAQTTLNSDESYARLAPTETTSATDSVLEAFVVKFGLDSVALDVYIDADTVTGHTAGNVTVRLQSKEFYSQNYTTEDSVIWTSASDTIIQFTGAYSVDKFYKVDGTGSDNDVRVKFSVLEWVFNRK